MRDEVPVARSAVQVTFSTRAQVLASAFPSRPIAHIDAFDTVIASPPGAAFEPLRVTRLHTHGIPRVARRMAWAYPTDHPTQERLGNATILVGGECNSWPVCYLNDYPSDSSVGRCLKTSPGICFPNGGAQIGRAAPLLRFIDAEA